MLTLLAPVDNLLNDGMLPEAIKRQVEANIQTWLDGDVIPLSPAETKQLALHVRLDERDRPG